MEGDVEGSGEEKAVDADVAMLAGGRPPLSGGEEDCDGLSPMADGGDGGNGGGAAAHKRRAGAAPAGHGK